MVQPKNLMNNDAIVTIADAKVRRSGEHTEENGKILPMVRRFLTYIKKSPPALV